MPTYRAKLSKDAYDKAQEHDTGVSIFENEDRYKQRVDDDGYVTLRKREFDRLHQLGLIEDSETDPIAEAADPDADLNTRTHTLTGRRLGKPTAVHPGGVGHQPDDAYSNQQVQREIQLEDERGAALRAEKGLPPLKETIGDESRRSDGHMPDQVKAHEKLTRETEQAAQKARDEAAKDRDKERKEQEKETAKAEREQEKRAEREQRGDSRTRDEAKAQDGPNPDHGNPQGQDQPEKQSEPDRNRGDGESKGKAKAAEKRQAGAEKDRS